LPTPFLKKFWEFALVPLIFGTVGASMELKMLTPLIFEISFAIFALAEIIRFLVSFGLGRL